MSSTSENFDGFCTCQGHRCSTCGFCADWVYEKQSEQWKRRSGYTCKRGHVDPDLNHDLDAGARQAKKICQCV